ncbi:MAG: tyrosine-protein phosphatase [Clostridia bacterium]|nr:tyrosine-protein phosphatase [Clostridia bacterium]
MQKVLNFRDLGGIPTGDGRKVKNCLFYRSAMLNDATKEDIEYLRNLNLRVIFDYRDEDETVMVKKNPYGEIGAKYINLPAAMNNDKLFKLKKSSFLSRVFLKFSLDDIKVSYRNLPFDNESYRAMVKAMQQGEVPFLQHCTAGKDRAGMGSVILLLILGAKYEDILADYMKSLEIKEHIEKQAARFVPKALRRVIMKRFEPLFVVDKALLDAAFEAIIGKYGSVENYLKCEFSLEQSDITKLRDRYTE